MRLELTSRTDLALRALRHLRGSGARESRVTLADELHTSPDFLARVMAPLVNQGWVDSRPGRSGGYLLSEEAGQISVLDVIHVTEGVPLDRCVLRSGPCEPDEKCALHDAWTKARDALLAELSVSPALAPASGNGGS
jgi:Rrf2 family protein